MTSRRAWRLGATALRLVVASRARFARTTRDSSLRANGREIEAGKKGRSPEETPFALSEESARARSARGDDESKGMEPWRDGPSTRRRESRSLRSHDSRLLAQGEREGDRGWEERPFA